MVSIVVAFKKLGVLDTGFWGLFISLNVMF